MRLSPSAPNSAGFYTCPICGFAALARPPYDSDGYPTFGICPCCATEYGYQDVNGDFDRLRAEWVERGMPWSSEVNPAPDNWDPREQLRSADF
jgi:hypothetical protein